MLYEVITAFGVHGIGGLVGSILTGLFASTALGGTESIGIGRQLGVQLLACAVTAAWSAAATWALLLLSDLV